MPARLLALAAAALLTSFAAGARSLPAQPRRVGATDASGAVSLAVVLLEPRRVLRTLHLRNAELVEATDSTPRSLLATPLYGHYRAPLRRHPGDAYRPNDRWCRGRAPR